MNEDQIQEYELEITANCNAECPMCQRTEMHMPLRGNNELTLADIQSIFKTRKQIEGKTFKLCGTIGDPIINPECLEICQYLSDNGAAKIALSTNGGYNSPEWWMQLAHVPKISVEFAIDGAEKTNHIYRINVKWKTLERNIRAYSEAGGYGSWTFIPFGHNEDEFESAKALAEELGLRFRRRTSGRNEMVPRVMFRRKPTKAKESTTGTPKKIELKKISTDDLVSLRGSDVHKHNDLDKLKKIRDAQFNGDNEVVEEAIATISCKYLNRKEMFVGSDKRLYPCCFIYSSHLRKNTDEKPFELECEDPDFNDLTKHSVDEILASESFATITDRWSTRHENHIARCVRTCAEKGAYLNKIETISERK